MDVSWQQLDLSWQQYGVCRQFDPDLFFLEGHGKAAGERIIIKTACAVCPVRRKCLDYALMTEQPQYGVWGGRTERQIAVLRKARGKRYSDTRGWDHHAA